MANTSNPDQFPNETSQNDEAHTHANVDFSELVELAKQGEQETDPIAAIIDKIDTYKSSFLGAVSEVSTDNITDPEALKVITARMQKFDVSFFMSSYELSQVMVKEGFSEEESVIALANQYINLDSTLNAQLNEQVGAEGLFMPVDGDELLARITQTYSQAKSSMDISSFSHQTANQFLQLIRCDVMTFLDFTKNQHDMEREQSKKDEIDAILANTQRILEAVQGASDLGEESRQERLSRYAQNAAKIALGAALGFIIARDFPRKS